MCVAVVPFGPIGHAEVRVKVLVKGAFNGEANAVRVRESRGIIGMTLKKLLHQRSDVYVAPELNVGFQVDGDKACVRRKRVVIALRECGNRINGVVDGCDAALPLQAFHISDPTGDTTSIVVVMVMVMALSTMTVGSCEGEVIKIIVAIGRAAHQHCVHGSWLWW